MGNPPPRTQSLPRQRPSNGPKWDSFSKTNRPHALFSNRHLANADKVRTFISGELTSTGRPRAFLSGELPLTRTPAPVSPSKRDVLPLPNHKDAASKSVHSDSAAPADETKAALCEVTSYEKSPAPEEYAMEKEELLEKKEAVSDVSSAPLRKCSSAGPSTTSIQTEKEGSHSRLLSRGGESSSFRGKLSSSSRRDTISSSFRKETVSSSFRKETVSSGTRRKATRSFQDGEVSSIASESVRGSPCSIHYNQGPISAKMTPAPAHGSWIDSPSSPEGGFEASGVPFHWEDAPGKAKTIAAAAEMALARKLSRDESIRKLNAASPRSSVDGPVQWEKKAPAPARRASIDPPQSSAVLPLPPAKREFSREFPLPRKDPHSSQLIEELKAAVVRKQSEHRVTGAKSAEREDDNRSVMSDFCGHGEEAHIDLVAPSAAKFLTQEDDLPILTPIKTPAAIPFKWEEAPGKPKGSASPPPDPEPPLLSLPPRLLGGCRNLSKEAQAKILQTYSCNLSEMHWTSSGNPTPLSRSRDHTPTRRDRTPTRRERTPTRRDTTPTRRDITPSRRDSTPTRSYFSARGVPRSGPLSSYPPLVPVLDNVRDYHSGPLRNNTGPNYLNIVPRSVSQEFALPIVVPPRNVSQEFVIPKSTSQESAVKTLAHDMASSSGPSEGSSSNVCSRKDMQVVRKDSPAHNAAGGKSTEGDAGDAKAAEQKKEASVKGGKGVDPWSPTSILCGPELSSQKTNSNLSTAYAESSHSHRQSISSHTKSDSCISVESFADDVYNQPPWSGSITPSASPYRDLGPIDNPSESTQGNKSLEDGVKAIVKFCRKAKKWNKSKTPTRKNSAEPDIWAPTLTTYFQKMEIGGTIISKVGSQVFPETKESRSGHLSGEHSVQRSPANLIPRSGELGTPDRSMLRRALGNQTPVQVISICRSPTYRVLATDECFSIFSLQRVWNSTKARQAKWGKKMRRSSRVMVSVCAALRRSLLLKCGRHSLPTLPSESKLLDRDETVVKEHAVHALSAHHQFHRPL